MRRSQLPELYKDLLKLREDQQYPDRRCYGESIRCSLRWSQTPEGCTFWQPCHHANTVADLPPIPESSIQELIALNRTQSPMNTNLIFDYNGQILHPEFQALAQRRREENPMNEEDQNYLIDAFDWSMTPEDHEFWSRVNEARATDADLAIAIEANRGYSKYPSTKKEQPSTPEPKKHSTMEDVFAGMNRHAKKEDNTKKEKLTEEDKELLNKIEARRHLGTTGEEDSTRRGSPS